MPYSFSPSVVLRGLDFSFFFFRSGFSKSVFKICFLKLGGWMFAVNPTERNTAKKEMVITAVYGVLSFAQANIIKIM